MSEGQEDGGSSTAPSAAERVNVALTARTCIALELVKAITSDTKTDIINRALQTYAYLESEVSDGNEICIRNKESGELQRLKFI